MAITLPRLLLHLEGAAVVVASAWAYSQWGMGWGWFAALILAPDLSMLGHLAGSRVGAACYNAAHMYAAHIGGDRMLGFGLKYPTAFRDTHFARV